MATMIAGSRDGGRIGISACRHDRLQRRIRRMDGMAQITLQPTETGTEIEIETGIEIETEIETATVTATETGTETETEIETLPGVGVASAAAAVVVSRWTHIFLAMAVGDVMAVGETTDRRRGMIEDGATTGMTVDTTETAAVGTTTGCGTAELAAGHQSGNGREIGTEIVIAKSTGDRVHR